MDITDLDISEFLESEESVAKHKQLVAECEAFMNSVGQLPIEVYRMEKFKPTKQPDDSAYAFWTIGACDEIIRNKLTNILRKKLLVNLDSQENVIGKL